MVFCFSLQYHIEYGGVISGRNSNFALHGFCLVGVPIVFWLGSLLRVIGLGWEPEQFIDLSIEKILK